MAIPVNKLGLELEAWRLAQAQTDARGHFAFEAVEPGLPHHLFLFGADPDALPEPLTGVPVLPALPPETGEPLTLTTHTPHLVLRVAAHDGLALVPLAERWDMTWSRYPDGAPACRGTFRLNGGPARECLPRGVHTAEPKLGRTWWSPLRASQLGKRQRVLDDGRIVLALLPGEAYDFHAMSLGLESATLHVDAVATGLEERTLTLGPQERTGRLSVTTAGMPADSTVGIYTPAGILLASRWIPSASMCAMGRSKSFDFQLPAGDWRVLVQSPEPAAPSVWLDLSLTPGEDLTRSFAPEGSNILVTAAFRTNGIDEPTSLTHESAWRKLLGPTWDQRALAPPVGGQLLIEAEQTGGHFRPMYFRTQALEPSSQSLPRGRYRFTLSLPGRAPRSQTIDLERALTITLEV